MAFSQYETDLHDTKNEPFTAKAMAEWVRSAQENGGKGMPPRVLGSIRAVDRDKWDPTDVEVAECLNALASKGFLKPEGASGNQTLYRINV